MSFQHIISSPYVHSTHFGFSGVIMGMLLILIAFYLQTETVLLSIPSMLLAFGIMLVNNIRDLKGGRKTLAILADHSNAITILMLFFIISNGWIFAMILFGHFTPRALLVFLNVKMPVGAITVFRKNHIPIHVMTEMKNTAVTNTLFSLLLGIGILIGHLLLIIKEKA